MRRPLLVLRAYFGHYRRLLRRLKVEIDWMLLLTEERKNSLTKHDLPS
jgi:hypothetical protein